MKLLILILVVILAGCERIDSIRQKDGHVFIWVPCQEINGHYKHDEKCSKCGEIESKYD